jgi:excisionase family DNA binding protein
MADIMTAKELSRYLKLHEITIYRYAANGQIPATRIGQVWRFDRDIIDDWIRTAHDQSGPNGRPHSKDDRKKPGKKKSKK